MFVKAVLENYEPPQTYFDGLKAAETKKQTEAQAKEAERKAKIQKQEQEAWREAENRLRNLPETERSRLWEIKRRSIPAEPRYKDVDAAKLRILESVIDGLIRSSLIEDFIREEEVEANSVR